MVEPQVDRAENGMLLSDCPANALVNEFWQPVLIGVWIGVVLGYVEGIGLYVVQTFVSTQYISLGIIWIAPLVYAVVFGFIGLLLTQVGWQFPRMPIIKYSFFCFLLLVAIDGLEMIFPEKLARYAKVLLSLGLATAALRWVSPRQARILPFIGRTLPWCLLLVPISCLIIQSALWATETYQTMQLPKASGERTNVVILVLDTLRADHLSSYGYHRPTSPNIDRLAQQGIRFQNAFSTSSWTLPSHASLFTGMYPHEHGVGVTRERFLQGKHHVVADELRSYGYRTGAFSANVFWVTHDRLGQGFIHFADYFHSATDMVLRTMYGRAFEHFVMQKLGWEDIPARKRAADINQAFLRWLDKYPDRPFFAFLNYFDIHDPYLPPTPFRGRFSSDVELRGIINWRVGRNNPDLTASEKQSEIDAYDSAIAYVDQNIQRLIDALKQRNLLDNTIIVLTSDHGEAFQEHGYVLHGNSLYREELHVPLIFYYPKRLPQGLTISQPVTIAAIPATIVEILEHDNQVFPVQSLAALWSSQAKTGSFPIAETGQKRWSPAGSPAYEGSLTSLITPEWHFIKHEKRGSELYAWNNDPAETENLARRDEYKQLVLQLNNELLQRTNGQR